MDTDDQQRGSHSKMPSWEAKGGKEVAALVASIKMSSVRLCVMWEQFGQGIYACGAISVSDHSMVGLPTLERLQTSPRPRQ